MRLHFFSLGLATSSFPPLSLDPNPIETSEVELGPHATKPNQHYSHHAVMLDKALNLGLEKPRYWWIQDLTWIRGQSGPATFVGLINDNGDIVLVPRVRGPIEIKNLTESGTKSKSDISLTTSFHIDFGTTNPASEAFPSKYSIGPHPTDARFVCSNGFALAEFSTHVPSILGLLRRALSEPIKSLDDLIDLWRMTLCSESWSSTDLRVVFDALIQKFIILAASAECPGDGLPFEILSRCLSFNVLGWNFVYQTAFHATVTLTERLFDLLLIASEYKNAFQTLELAERSLASVFSLVRIGTRYGDPNPEIDILRSRSRLSCSFAFREQWSRLLKALEDVKQKTPSVSELVPLVRARVLEEKKESLAQLVDLDEEDSSSINEARKLFVQQKWGAARDALNETASSYLWAFLPINFHLGEIKWCCDMSNYIISSRPRPPSFFSVHPVSFTSESPQEYEMDSGDSEMFIEREAINDPTYWGSVYFNLILARAMSDYFVGKDICLISPTSNNLPIPTPLHSLSPGSKPASVMPLTTKQHIVIFRRFSPTLQRAVQSVISSSSGGTSLWSVRRCVALFRWCRRPKEAIQFCQTLVAAVRQVKSNADSPLAQQIRNADEKFDSPHHQNPRDRRGSLPASSLSTLPSLREICELATALTMVESGLVSKLLSPTYFWHVLQWHLLTALETWDLHALLSLFDAHLSLLPTSVSSSHLPLISPRKPPSITAGTAPPTSAPLLSITVPDKKPFRDTTHSPPALLALFSAVRFKFAEYSIQYWTRKIQCLLSDEVGLPMILIKKSSRKGTSRNYVPLIPPKLLNIPSSLTPLSHRSPLAPLFVLPETQTDPSEVPTPIISLPNHRRARTQIPDDSMFNSSRQSSPPKWWDDHRAFPTSAPVKTLSHSRTSSLADLKMSSEELEEENEMQLARNHDDAVLGKVLFWIERTLHLVNTLTFTRPLEEQPQFRTSYAHPVFRFIWSIEVRHRLRHYAELLHRMPARSDPKHARERSNCALECAFWTIRLIPFADIISPKNSPKPPQIWLQSRVLAFAEQIEVGADLVTVLLRLQRTSIHPSLKRPLEQLLKKIEKADSSVYDQVQSLLSPTEKSPTDGEEMDDPDKVRMYSESEHLMLDADFGNFRQHMMQALIASRLKETASNTLSAMVRDMLNEEEKWSPALEKKSQKKKEDEAKNEVEIRKKLKEKEKEKDKKSKRSKKKSRLRITKDKNEFDRMKEDLQVLIPSTSSTPEPLLLPMPLPLSHEPEPEITRKGSDSASESGTPTKTVPLLPIPKNMEGLTVTVARNIDQPVSTPRSSEGITVLAPKSSTEGITVVVSGSSSEGVTVVTTPKHSDRTITTVVSTPKHSDRTITTVVVAPKSSSEGLTVVSESSVTPKIVEGTHPERGGERGEGERVIVTETVTTERQEGQVTTSGSGSTSSCTSESDEGKLALTMENLMKILQENPEIARLFQQVRQGTSISKAEGESHETEIIDEATKKDKIKTIRFTSRIRPPKIGMTTTSTTTTIISESETTTDTQPTHVTTLGLTATPATTLGLTTSTTNTPTTLGSTSNSSIPLSLGSMLAKKIVAPLSPLPKSEIPGRPRSAQKLFNGRR